MFGAIALKNYKIRYKNMQLSSRPQWAKDSPQSKVAYYSPRSENHQKVTPEQRKNFETSCTRYAHIKQYGTN